MNQQKRQPDSKTHPCLEPNCRQKFADSRGAKRHWLQCEVRQAGLASDRDAAKRLRLEGQGSSEPSQEQEEHSQHHSITVQDRRDDADNMDGNDGIGHGEPEVRPRAVFYIPILIYIQAQIPPEHPPTVEGISNNGDNEDGIEQNHDNIVSLRTQSRFKRTYRRPARFDDYLPSGQIGLLQSLVAPTNNDHHSPSPSQPVSFQTCISPDGTYRVYKKRPASIPDAHQTLQDRSSAIPTQPTMNQTALENLLQSYGYPNMSHYLLTHWHETGSNLKSIGEVKRLVSECLLHPSFKIEDIKDYKCGEVKKHFNSIFQPRDTPSTSSSSTRESNPRIPADMYEKGWRRGSVTIPMLHEGAKISEKLVPKFEVKDILYRQLIPALREFLDSPSSVDFNFQPFKKMWLPDPSLEPMRVYDEYYTADNWQKLQDHIDGLPREPGDTSERCVIAFVIYSDGTSLTKFGNTSAHPMYIMVVIQSKYHRSKPSARACIHVLYFPEVSKL